MFDDLCQQILPTLQRLFDPCAESEVAVIGIYRTVYERASPWKSRGVDIVVYVQFESRFTSASRLAGKQAARFRTHSTRRKSSFVSKFRIPHFTPCFVS